LADLIQLGIANFPRAVPAAVAPTKPQGRYLEAARQTRLTNDWTTSTTSADIDLWADIYRARARARMVAQNNPLAAKYLYLCQKNVVGKDGVKLQAKVPMKKGKSFNDKLNQQIERAWRNWGRKQSCTVNGKFTWAQAQRFAVLQKSRDGECHVRMVVDKSNPFNFSLQFLDPDQLDTNYYLYRMQNGNEIRMGIECNAFGKPIAYHFWNRHPQEYSIAPLARIRVPAEEIVHYYRPDRVMQSRGITPMGPSILAIHMLSRYHEAELVAARVGASKQGFFESSQSDDAQYAGERDENLNIKMNADPGTFEQLPPGLKFAAWDPTHPTSAYPAFVKSSQRQIGAGLDVSYESLANDREGVNYSSIRAGLLDERDSWGVQQNEFISEFCMPIFERWLEAAWLSGQLPLLTGLPSDLTNEDGFFKWHPRGFPWVDPLKDMQASVLAVQNGFKNQTALMGENGDDFEEGMQQLKYEQDYIKELHVKIGTDTKGIADTAEDDQDAQTSGGSGAQAKNEKQEKEGN
jgi:lambda family phage portal protein